MNYHHYRYHPCIPNISLKNRILPSKAHQKPPSCYRRTLTCTLVLLVRAVDGDLAKTLRALRAAGLVVVVVGKWRQSRAAVAQLTVEVVEANGAWTHACRSVVQSHREGRGAGRVPARLATLVRVHQGFAVAQRFPTNYVICWYRVSVSLKYFNYSV